MYICKHFKLYELLPKSIYKQHRGWHLFDDRILMTMDKLRSYFGPIVINDWKWGGHNQYRGYRPEGCKIGAKYSQHKYGRAIDFVPVSKRVDFIRNFIIVNNREFPHITTVEMETSWIHIDVRNVEPIMKIYPKEK